LGKHFIVSPSTPEGDAELRNVYFSDEYAGRVCIGGLGDDPSFYFYGDLNLNNTTIYTKFPIFGTISDGASIHTGSVIISDDGSQPEIYGSAGAACARE
jgi:hypothetical protein